MATILPVRLHVKENLKLAIPVMLSNLGHVLMGLCDNVMVGHVSALSLAAAGLANVAFNVLLLFGIGVSYAITPLVATADGEGNDKDIIDTMRHGLVVNIVNGVLLACIVVFGKEVLYHLNQPREVIDLSLPYLSIVTFSLIPVLIFQSFRQFAEGMSNTRIALTVVIASNVINVILNYIFIYGHLGFPAMGLNGAGYATFISRVFMALGIIIYLYNHPRFKQFRKAFVPGLYSSPMLRRILHLGIPSGIQFIFEVTAFDFSLIMMGWLGSNALAAHQIVINLATLSYMVTSGLAAAGTIRISYFAGRRDPENLRRSSNTMLLLGMTVMLVFALIFISANTFLPHLYVNDTDVIRIASVLLIIAGLFQLSDGAQVICIAALRGLQDVKVPMVLIFVAYWLVGLPMGYWLAFNKGMGAQGIWLGLLTGLTLTALLMYTRLRFKIREQWESAIVREK